MFKSFCYNNRSKIILFNAKKITRDDKIDYLNLKREFYETKLVWEKEYQHVGTSSPIEITNKNNNS